MTSRNAAVQSLYEWRKEVDAKPAERQLPADLLSIARVRELEETYLPEDLQRDYDSTIGRRAGDPGT